MACRSSSALISYEILGQIFGLITFFLSKRWVQVVLDGNSSQEYPVNAGVPQGSILSPTLFLLSINTDLADDVICNIAIYADDTLYSKCDRAFDLWQQLELASEHGARSGLLISMLGKVNWFYLTGLITLVQFYIFLLIILN